MPLLDVDGVCSLAKCQSRCVVRISIHGRHNDLIFGIFAVKANLVLLKSFEPAKLLLVVLFRPLGLEVEFVYSCEVFREHPLRHHILCRFDRCDKLGLVTVGADSIDLGRALVASW